MSTPIPVAVTAPAEIRPGRYRGVPYDVYASWDAVRHSILRHFNRSAAHAYQAMTDPAPQTDAQALGHTAHVAILEPDRFEATFAAQPYMGDRKSSKVRAEEQAFRDAHPGITFLPPAEFDQILKIRDSVWSHPTAAELLRGRRDNNEVSGLWVDPETGVRCKSRYDRLAALGTFGIVVDLKSARNASRAAFAKDILYFHYHQAAAMYLSGLAQLADHPRKFMFVVVEKEPPYCTAVYELEEDAIDLGRDEFRKHLRMYAECTATGVWPGYGNGADIVSLPPWAFRPTQGD